jgi:hypothetical protein
MFGSLSIVQKIIGGFALIVIVTGLFFGGKYIYDESIRRNAQLQWNNDQLTRVVQELQEQKAALDRFNTSAKIMLDELNKRNQELEERGRKMDAIIDRSPDGPAPQVFRDLFKALGAR